MQELIEKHFNTIANNVRRFRESADFSQEQLAEKLDCSREFINRVEKIKENLSLKMLLKIAIILKISPQTFFDE